ncbi:MAG: DinB family protein [Oscillochloris sp.]|nr:DinB family protein [Oscillochloris sp.]
MSTDTRREIPNAAGEYEMLDAFLEWHQQTVLLKIAGLSETDLRRTMTPSGVTPLGVVKHLAYVHRFWFRVVFLGEDVAMPWSETDRDADWRIEPEDSTAAISALYQDEVDRGRAIAAAHSLDEMAKNPLRQKSLRWIVVHMLEEIARHNGHLDMMREAIDGQTGE